MNRTCFAATAVIAFLILSFPVALQAQQTLQVGPGKQFATPCAAIAAASSGDTIQIDSSGNYNGDVCQWSTDNLTLIGVGGGRAVINAAGNNSEGKGNWVISGNNNTVENIEFTGATVPDDNGAGIRAEGNNLTIRNCYFHDNQEGILTDAGPSTILIEYTEFARNGFGDGFTHNVYVGNITKLIFRYNYSHDSIVGHLLKSRAAENDIYYNLLADGPTGTGSYEIDLPNGGLSYVIGNLIEQGPMTQNDAILSYQEEGANAGNPSHQLFVINNTFVNDFTNGTFIVVDGSVTIPAVIENNIFQGPGTLTDQASAVLTTNFSGNAKLVDPANFNYHLQSGSPAIDKGTTPGPNGSVSLVPVFQYVNNLCAEQRSIAGAAIDIGAYEFNGGNGVPPPNAPAGCGSNAPPAPSAVFSPTSLSFGNQVENTASSQQPAKLSNGGTASLSISSITITGADPGDFSQTNNCGASVAAGSFCTINVTFKPGVTGPLTASISVADNAAGSPQTLGLTGTGTQAPQADFSISDSPLSSTLTAGASANFKVTVTSENGFNQAVALSCAGAPADSTCSFSANSVTPSPSTAGSSTVTITTTARSSLMPAPRLMLPTFPSRMILFLLAALLPVWLLSKQKRSCLALCSATAIILLCSACVGGTANTSNPGGNPGGQTGTPAGNYTITIHATSGSLSHTSTYALTVN